MSQQQFESLTASSLYCDKCKVAMPVRERLLLVLPEKEIYDYLCTGCASSVGQREVTAGGKIIGQSTEERRPRRTCPACILPFLRAQNAYISSPGARRAGR